MGSAVGSAGYAYFGGSLWPGYSSWSDFFNQVCGISIDRNYLETTESCGYFWTLNGICFAAERPSEIHLNEDGQLHNESGPAVTYSDGSFSVWAINGVVVNEQIVLRPGSQSISEIEKESNEEIRRVQIDRFGWPRYLQESGAKSVDGRRNDVDGTEERLMRLNDGSLRLLCACRSTARVYAIGVPKEITSCEQAQNWMIGGSSPIVKRGICVGAS